MRRFALSSKVQTALSVILVGVLGLLATGCTSAAKTSTTYQIRVWRYNQSVDPLRDVFNQFESAHSNVNITYSDHTLDTYETDALASLASETGPELWSFPNSWMGDEQSRLVPLPDNFFGDPAKNGGMTATDWVKKIYPPSVANTLIGTDGKAYGLATNFDLLRIYYNPDVFNQSINAYVQSLGDNPPDSETQPVETLLSGPPTTWSQLEQQVPYLTKSSGGTITQSAITLGTADNIPTAEDILALLMYQNGTNIISTDRTATLFNDQQTTPSGAIVRPGENALDFYTSFAIPGNPNYTWSPSMPDALDAFGEGKVAMVIAYQDFGQDLQAKYPQLHYDTADIPQINTTSQAVHFGRFSVDGVTKAASNVPLSLDLLYQVDGSDSASNLAQEANLRSPLVKTLQAQASSDAESNAILTADTLYEIGHTQFDNDFLQMIRDVTQNGATVAGALDVAAQNINNLLSPPAAAPSASPDN